MAYPDPLLIDRFEARFDLDKLNDIWDAAHVAIKDWEEGGCQQHKSFFPTFEEAATRYITRMAFYKYDNFGWWLTVIANDFGPAGTILNIKFLNDSFLCEKRQNMHVLRDKQRFHNSDGWSILDLKQYHTTFGAFKSFSRSWLKHLDLLRFQATYNYDLGRIDFKALDDTNNRSVCISFEPGKPESDVSDLWLEEK
jgi:hypothetical protein